MAGYGAKGRDDLSDYLVHLTRDGQDGSTARDNLLSILSGYKLEARGIHAAAETLAGLGVDEKRLRTVCMSEAPLGQLPKLAADMPGRQKRLSPYGVILRHDEVVRQGGNRVWYINQRRGSLGGDWLTKEIESLMDVAAKGHAYRIDGDGDVFPVAIDESPIVRIAPFVDWVSSGKDFAWEREWRVIGDLWLTPPILAGMIVPAADHQAFHVDMANAHKETGYAEHGVPLVSHDWPDGYIEDLIEGRTQ